VKDVRLTLIGGPTLLIHFAADVDPSNSTNHVAMVSHPEEVLTIIEIAVGCADPHGSAVADQGNDGPTPLAVAPRRASKLSRRGRVPWLVDHPRRRLLDLHRDRLRNGRIR
jgi:hypothetical protein